MKKQLRNLSIVFMVLLIAGACANARKQTGGGAADNGAPPVKTAEAAPDNGKGTLNLAIFEGGYGKDFWIAAASLFESRTGISVNMEIDPNIGDIIRPRIVAGDVPDFLNLMDNDQTGVVAALIQERALLDLTSVFDGPQYDSGKTLRSKILPGFLESNKCAPYAGESAIYLAPGNSSPMGLIYNITLFEEKGWKLPITWDDYFALGDRAKADGYALQTYQGIYPGYMESMLFPALASALGEDYAKIENLTPGIWTDSRTVSVLRQFERIYADGYLMKGTVGLNHTESQAAQMMNQALFIPNGTWMEGEMEDADRAAGYRFGMLPPPVLKAGDTRYVAASVEQFSIPLNAKNALNAKLFLRFLYTDEIIALYAEKSGGAVMSTVNALDVVKPYISEGAYGMFGAFSEKDAAALVFGFAAPPENSGIVVNDAIFNPLTDVMSGKMTALEWAASIDEAYRDIAAGK